MSRTGRPLTRGGSRGVSSFGGTIRFRVSSHNVVYDVLKKKGWKETSDELDWDINWADTGWIREYFDHVHLEEGQRVNHFRNHYELTRKDLLVKNLKRARKQMEKDESWQDAPALDFFPATYVLPAEYGLFVEEFKRAPGSTWIMKPIGKAQGKGIFLIKKLSQISDWKKDYRWRSEQQQAETYVVQRYVENPYLVGGKKFDLRLYVLVTSYSPLKVYTYRSGFARFSNHRFSMSKGEISNTLIHLTNHSIQKHADGYDSKSGQKWDLRDLKLFMASKHGFESVDKLFKDMEDLIVLTLRAVQKTMINDKHCFELYGYDIIIDDNMKPFLLEVNASPSLSADTEQDYSLKAGLVEDVIAIVDLERKLTGDELQVGGFDLVWNNGPVSAEPNTMYQSHLGCYNDRVENMQKLRKAMVRRQQATSGP